LAKDRWRGHGAAESVHAAWRQAPTAAVTCRHRAADQDGAGV